MTNPIPSRDVLKAQAKRLRADLATKGTPISHAAALETLAHQWGMRDWNTLSAKAGIDPAGWYPAQKVKGQYLSHAFTGWIKAARQSVSGYWSLTIRFDTPVDVVASEHFSNLRQQVDTTVNTDGQSPQKTSDGRPHMVLQAA